MMGGLARICKHYGRMKATGPDGKSVMWVYDYAADKPVLESEMPEGSERWKQSERTRWNSLRKQLDEAKKKDTQ